MRPAHRREAYAADITYGTNNEFGFDYLRDNMALRKDSLVQRDLSFAIVDEVDYIFIDEARTPLIISGPSSKPSSEYYRFADFARRLKYEDDYTKDDKTKSVSITEEGVAKIESWTGVTNIYDPANYTLVHYLENALKAEAHYHLDKEYVVQDGQVIIVDEFTGRLMPGRRFGDGLHQAIEAKEKLEVQQETVTLATITLQNYFRLYPKLAGMTGTAATEEEELWKIYGLQVVVIPTNKPILREDDPDIVYLNLDAKFKAVAEEVEDAHKKGRPVLIGTASIEASERLSGYLKARDIPHQVLNAKFHEKEAQIVAQAGHLRAVTVATNMAGRGTDIILGGSPAGRGPDEWQKEHDAVIALGGLYVIGTERHESRRIDNQLRGRAGRQGDPGTTIFFVSLEDDVIRMFGGDRVRSLMNWAGADADEAIDNNMVRKAFENAQVKVEARNYEIRKHLVDYDDVINTQRDVIYKERRKIIDGVDLAANIQDMTEREIEALCDEHMPDDREESWDLEALLDAYRGLIGALPDWGTPDRMELMSREDIEDGLVDFADLRYEERQKDFSEPVTREVERLVSLQTMDTHWVEHLTTMDTMRQGIGLEAIGQRDPLVAYRKQAHGMWEELQEIIQSSIVRNMYHVTVRREPAQRPTPPPTAPGAPGAATTAPRPASGAPLMPPLPVKSPMASQQRDARTGEVMSRAGMPIANRGGVPVGATPGAPKARKKVGRNEQCPCGSGKKYKHCHYPEFG
jgi:preprotein translocase subunit SecA